MWNCCILLVDLFESYDDARNCERQKVMITCFIYDPKTEENLEDQK